MRKLFFLLTLLAAYATASADDGVSLSLATYRSATVSNVRYDLGFTVPDSLSQPVTGRAVVTFRYTGDRDLPLDFTGKLLKNGRNAWCDINGNACKVVVEGGHIILPYKLLRHGDNTVSLTFVSGDASLNRHADYMYTLFVPANARSCFPCFDQPDLKARFTLDLRCPKGWESISSADSHVLPTYLFSFVCGKFRRQTAVRDGRVMTALYRETDSAKVAQLGKVFDEAALSLRWMEDYTGMKYPFDSYGFVVLPGYQFGGMEHPGAIQLTDNEIFLGTNPTPDEELTRLELIAHETAHAWFGDMVTMRWFNDVWTKEVFANFLANKISREVYPNINHDLNFLKSYQRPALSVDRTGGTHPIQQPLDNLRDAGLLYGSIIYDKAPVMMRKLEQQATPQAFRAGLRAYLRRYSYGNATWDDLVDILDSVAPAARLKEFSEVWVKQKGLPTISYALASDGKSLTVSQSDPFGRGVTWPQRFAFAIDYDDCVLYKDVDMDKASVTIPLTAAPPRSRYGRKPHVYPNVYGQGYGRFIINAGDMDANIDIMVNGQGEDETAAYSALLNLNENFLMGRLSGDRFFAALCQALDRCDDPLVGSTIVAAMSAVRHYAADSLRHACERQSLRRAMSHRLRPVRQQLLRSLSAAATDASVLDTLYNMWRHQADTTVLPKGMLTTRNFTAMAYHLAILMPARARDILGTQRALLRTADERREFDYVSLACTADTSAQRRLFYEMIPKEGRAVEPWARQRLALLCDRAREPQCNSYIKPGLDSLLMIQHSSDIFFPGYWLSALLSGQHSDEARGIVESWIAAHPRYPEPLMNKLKQAAYSLGIGR